jgi:hypothetical protein
LPRSALHISARSLSKVWNPAPAILHRESPCLMRHTYLFNVPQKYEMKHIRGEMLRPKISTTVLSWHDSRDTIPLSFGDRAIHCTLHCPIWGRSFLYFFSCAKLFCQWASFLNSS